MTTTATTNSTRSRAERVVVYALVTDQGTAMPESALCGADFRTGRVSREAEAALAADWEPSSGWHDCSGNVALSCNLCGAVAS